MNSCASTEEHGEAKKEAVAALTSFSLLLIKSAARFACTSCPFLSRARSACTRLISSPSSPSSIRPKPE